MKKVLLAGFVLVLGAIAASANGLGFSGAYWDTKNAGDGFGAGAKLQLQVVPGMFMEFRGTYFEDLSGDDKAAGIDSKLQVIPAEAGLIVTFPVNKQFKPYAGGGVGYYFADAKIEAEGLDEDIDIDDEMGYYAVGGFEIGLADNFYIFAEYKYTWVEFDTFVIEDIDYESDTKTVLDGPGGNIGLLLKW